jgi:hypothetical protein
LKISYEMMLSEQLEEEVEWYLYMYFNTNSNNSKNLFAQSKGERNSTSRRISEEQLRGIS